MRPIQTGRAQAIRENRDLLGALAILALQRVALEHLTSDDVGHCVEPGGSTMMATMDEIFGPTAEITWVQECARAVVIFLYGLVLVRLAGGACSASGPPSTSSSRS